MNNHLLEQAYTEDRPFYLDHFGRREQWKNLALRRLDAEVWMNQEEPVLPKFETKKKKVDIIQFLRSLRP